MLMELLLFVTFLRILICIISGANICTKNSFYGISSVVIFIEMILCVSSTITLYHLKEYATSNEIVEHFEPKPAIKKTKLEAANKIVFILSSILFAWLLVSAYISGYSDANSVFNSIFVAFCSIFGIITWVFGFSCDSNEYESVEITFTNKYILGSLIISISGLFWFFVYFILTCTIPTPSADGVRFVSIGLLYPNFVASWNGGSGENGDSVMTRLASSSQRKMKSAGTRSQANIQKLIHNECNNDSHSRLLDPKWSMIIKREKAKYDVDNACLIFVQSGDE